MIMRQPEREQSLSAVYALGVLAGQIDLKRLKRTLAAEHAEARGQGVGSSARFTQLLEVVDAAVWLDEAARALADTPAPAPAPAEPAPAPAPAWTPPVAIPDDWAPAAPK